MPQPLGLDLPAKRQRKLSDYHYHEEYRTRWADNDVFSHLNNPIYAVLIDSIINSYLITHCLYSPQHSQHIGLVANSFCDYFAAANYPGTLDVGLRVEKVGRSSVRYEVGVFQRGVEGVRAVGGFVQIWVGRASGKVEEEGVPGGIREGLKALMGDARVAKGSKL